MVTMLQPKIGQAVLVAVVIAVAVAVVVQFSRNSNTV
jgi:hypothetical protein